ncbi:hypothetical protein D3C72_1679580 [compost metagenome]
MAVGEPHGLAPFLRIRACHAFHIHRAVIEKHDAVAGRALDEFDLQFRQAELSLDGIRHPQAELDAVTDRFRSGAKIRKGNIAIGITELDRAGSGNGIKRRRLGTVTGRLGGQKTEEKQQKP